MTYNQIVNKIRKMNQLSNEMGYGKQFYIVLWAVWNKDEMATLDGYLAMQKQNGLKIAFEEHTTWNDNGTMKWQESFLENGEKLYKWEVREI